jgi:hypothetical protein
LLFCPGKACLNCAIGFSRLPRSPAAIIVFESFSVAVTAVTAARDERKRWFAPGSPYSLESFPASPGNLRHPTSENPEMGRRVAHPYSSSSFSHHRGCPILRAASSHEGWESTNLNHTPQCSGDALVVDSPAGTLSIAIRSRPLQARRQAKLQATDELRHDGDILYPARWSRFAASQMGVEVRKRRRVEVRGSHPSQRTRRMGHPALLNGHDSERLRVRHPASGVS